MSDAKLSQRRRGDERLMLTCLVVERLCAERVAASVRLKAAIGPVDTQRLVVPLARRLTTRGYSDRHQYDAARIVAAA
jgi:hypothetical protein